MCRSLKNYTTKWLVPPINCIEFHKKLGKNEMVRTTTVENLSHSSLEQNVSIQTNPKDAKSIDAYNGILRLIHFYCLLEISIPYSILNLQHIPERERTTKFFQDLRQKTQTYQNFVQEQPQGV